MRTIEADGLRLSVIGLGTWQFGSREWGYGDDYAREVAPALVRRAIELGITLIDTAEIYGFGRSERIVGEAIAGQRDRVVVATKLMPLLPIPPIVRRQVRGSLERLGVDAIDLYQVHWPNPFVSARAMMQRLRPALDDGLIRHVGVSNHSLERWEVSERALGRPVLSNQVPFSLARPGARADLVPYAAARGRVVIAYSPLAQGLLSGRHAAGAPAPRDIRRFNPAFRNAVAGQAGQLLSALREVAAAHGATPAQVALAWLIAHDRVVAIPGARTIAQLEENAAAADLVLATEELARLSEEAERFAAGTPGAPGAARAAGGTTP